MHSTYMKIYERLARDQYLTEILWLRVSKCLLRHNSMTLFCRSTVHCIFGAKYMGVTQNSWFGETVQNTL